MALNTLHKHVSALALAELDHATLRKGLALEIWVLWSQ
jgi:hypothetical protein